METVNQIEYNGALYNIQDAEAQKNLVYSQNEIDTGKIWIDGKKIYRKVVDCGTLPNNTQKQIPHNIKNYDIFLNVTGIAIIEDKKTYFNLPYTSVDDEGIRLTVIGENITITTWRKRDYILQTFVVLEYTKTTN